AEDVVAVADHDRFAYASRLQAVHGLEITRVELVPGEPAETASVILGFLVLGKPGGQRGKILFLESDRPQGVRESLGAGAIGGFGNQPDQNVGGTDLRVLFAGDLNDMVTEAGADRNPGIVSRFQGESVPFIFGIQGAALGISDVAAFLPGKIVGILFRQLGAGLAFVEALAERVGLYQGRLFQGRAGLYLDLDMGQAQTVLLEREAVLVPIVELMDLLVGRALVPDVFVLELLPVRLVQILLGQAGPELGQGHAVGLLEQGFELLLPPLLLDIAGYGFLDPGGDLALRDFDGRILLGLDQNHLVVDEPVQDFAALDVGRHAGHAGLLFGRDQAQFLKFGKQDDLVVHLG